MNLKLLDDVKEIIKNNEEEIIKTGKGFNLISLLGMEHNERYTHSNIIAELLKPNGSHTFGNKFFELFLEEVEIEDFSTTNYEVFTEEYVGSIKCSDGCSMRTFLDIVIKDKNNGNVILIENKIWAEDQLEQLERYYRSYQGNIIKLLYLNVHDYDYFFGSETVERELLEHEQRELNGLKAVYQKITYERNIRNWIANCVKVSSQEPFISYQIEVYYQTILKISNQNIYKKMDDKIINHIIDNRLLKEYFELIRNKELVQFAIVKRFIESTCDVSVVDPNFGNRDSFFSIFESNDFKMDIVFEKRLAGLYIKISTDNDDKRLILERCGKFLCSNDYNDKYFYKWVEEFTTVSWENLLEEKNVKQMKKAVDDIRELLKSL